MMFWKRSGLLIALLMTVLVLGACEEEETETEQAKFPPGTPGGLVATATGSTGEIEITWNNVAGATSYKLYVGSTSPVEAAGDLAIVPGVATPYTITGLPDAIPVFFKVLASNAKGDSSLSNEDTATPFAAAVPGIPGAVIPTPGDTQVALSWGVATGATTYNVYWGTSPGFAIPGIGSQTGLGATTTTVIGLTNGTPYYFLVTGVNAGGEGPAATEVTATPTLPAPPVQPVGFGVTPGDTQNVIFWTNDPAATSYNIYWKPTVGGVTTGDTAITGATNPFTHTGLANGIPYFYVVEAVNAGGVSPLSTEVSATPVAAGFVNEGAIGTPLNISGVLPNYNGQVADSGSSYYMVTGFASSQQITVDLFNLSSDVDMTLHDDNTFTSNSCLSSNIGTIPEVCTNLADISGNIFIEIIAFDPGGGTFQLNVSPTPPSEGTVGVPINAGTPIAGSVGPFGSSYYRISGLPTLTRVEIAVTGLQRDADITVYSDPFALLECQSFRVNSLNESCIAISNPTGDLFVQVDDYDGGGTNYTIDYSLPPASPTNEGSIGVPIVFDMANQQFNGKVGPTSNFSYYRMTGLAPFTFYTVQLFNLTEDADMAVFSTADFSTVQECSAAGFADRSFESCGAISDASGDLYIRVDSFGALGIYFSLNAF